MGQRISLRYKNQFSSFSFLFSNDSSVAYFMCNYIRQVAEIIHQISMELQVVGLNYSPPRSIANSTIRERAEIKGKNTVFLSTAIEIQDEYEFQANVPSHEKFTGPSDVNHRHNQRGRINRREIRVISLPVGRPDRNPRTETERKRERKGRKSLVKRCKNVIHRFHVARDELQCVPADGRARTCTDTTLFSGLSGKWKKMHPPLSGLFDSRPVTCVSFRRFDSHDRGMKKRSWKVFRPAAIVFSFFPVFFSNPVFFLLSFFPVLLGKVTMQLFSLSLPGARVRGDVSQCSLTIFRVVGHFRFRWIFDSRGSQRTIVFDVGVIRRQHRTIFSFLNCLSRQDSQYRDQLHSRTKLVIARYSLAENIR